jgi:hypothetical protein
MKTLFVGLIMSMVITTSASAGSRNHGHRGNYYHNGHHHHHHHRRNNVVPYIAGGLGLAILGGIIYDQYGRKCYKQIIGYDSWGDPVTRKVCE